MILQIMTPAADSADVVVEQSGNISFLDLALKGGIIMVPLLLLSILAIYIIVERVLTLKKATMNPESFLEEIRSLVINGNVDEAQKIAEKHQGPISRMIQKGLQKLGSPLKTIETSIENVGKLEIYKLEKNLSILATISGAAPMIGFLGTVAGMVQAFMEIAQQEGQVSPQLLSEGIYQAMITTIAGLIVGIVAYIGYNYLAAKLENIIHKMEYSVIEFIELLQEPH